VTASMVLGILGIALLAILVGYTIPTLIQLRKTALAAEEFLHGLTPKVESATRNLDSVLARVDRVFKGMEEGTRGISGALGGVGDFMSNLKPPAVAGGGPANWMAALASLLSGFWQAWSVFSTSRGAPAAARAAEGGRSHE